MVLATEAELGHNGVVLEAVLQLLELRPVNEPPTKPP